MIIAIAFISALYLIIAFTVNEKNAKWLLAGYNTMTPNEREKFDLNSFRKFFRKFHIILGITNLSTGILIKFLINDTQAALFISAYPLMAYLYFIITSNRKFNENGFQTQDIIGIIALLLSLLFVILLFVSL